MRIFTLIAGLLFSTQIVAANTCNNTGCISTISLLYTTANGPVYIGTPQDEKLANCTPVKNVYFTLNTNSKNAQEIYSTLLAAYMAGKKVKLRIIEGSSNCELSYVTLDSTH